MADVPIISSTGLSPRTGGALSYLGWWLTGAIFLIVERHDRYVRFHAAQAVVVFGGIAMLVAAFCALAAASLSFRPGAFAGLAIAAIATFVIGMLVWVIAMWSAASGHALRIPLAADLADRFSRS